MWRDNDIHGAQNCLFEQIIFSRMLDVPGQQ
jgi:hypothetical protein